MLSRYLNGFVIKPGILTGISGALRTEKVTDAKWQLKSLCESYIHFTRSKKPVAVAKAEITDRVMRILELDYQVPMTHGLFESEFHCFRYGQVGTELGLTTPLWVGKGPTVLSHKLNGRMLSSLRSYMANWLIFVQTLFSFDGDPNVRLPQGVYFRFYNPVNKDIGYLVCSTDSGLAFFDPFLCAVTAQQKQDPACHQGLTAAFVRILNQDLNS